MIRYNRALRSQTAFGGWNDWIPSWVPLIGKDTEQLVDVVPSHGPQTSAVLTTAPMPASYEYDSPIGPNMPTSVSTSPASNLSAGSYAAKASVIPGLPGSSNRLNDPMTWILGLGVAGMLYYGYKVTKRR